VASFYSVIFCSWRWSFLGTGEEYINKENHSEILINSLNHFFLANSTIFCRRFVNVKFIHLAFKQRQLSEAGPRHLLITIKHRPIYKVIEFPNDLAHGSTKVTFTPTPVASIDSSWTCSTSTLETYYLNFIAGQL